MSDQKRPYRKKRRAELEEATRRRITESAVELHGTLGPSRTSVSAVAEHAGVRRSTLYRHFPDEAALFAACSAHWRASNPPPNLEYWAAIDDPDERLRVALEELYAHYRRTARMMDNLLRDAATMPTVKRMFGGFRDYINTAHETLMAGRRARGAARRRMHAATGHALAFATWRSLIHEQGLDDPQAADLMCRLVDAASHRADTRSPPRAPAPTDKTLRHTERAVTPSERHRETSPSPRIGSRPLR
jgi:AcrR family transcriptional regulator